MPAVLPPPTVDVVVVEAARLPPSPVDRAFAIVSVGGEAIATAPRLDEALTATPGVQLFRRTSSNASNPTTQGMSVRSIAGSGASRALVTLDGVPQNDPFGGWVIWSGLPAIGVEQGRIVRGAGAGPYGAGALTGTIQLSERTSVPAHGEYDLYVGERGLLGLASARAFGDFLLTTARETSDGWIPVRTGVLPGDNPLFFSATSAAVRWAPQLDGRDLAVRAAAFQEARGAGVAGGNSRAVGASLSATLVDNSPGWRLQGWVKHSDLENRTGSRTTGVTSNEQYATPAWGAGFNAALRQDGAEGGWELGADARASTGETRERFGTGLTGNRISGGSQSVAGVYAEGYRQRGPWLATGGVRLDRWSTFDGERIQTVIAPSEEHPEDRSGWVPTARAGARRDHDGGYLRGAAYVGFRPPTLNELYRPFALAGSTTQANAALEPEKLYGAELGAGGLSWDITGFYNRLEGAITNVTIAPSVAQRQNAGAVDAWGLEGQAERRWDAVTVQVAAAYTHARVDGGPNAGLRPAQTPELTVSGSAVWNPIQPLRLRLTARYESSRWDEDRNTRKLGAATELALRADWTLNRIATLYVAAENLTDAVVETAQAFDGTESFDQPRTVRVGLVLRP
jgi:vitamin B12 transporter